AGAAIAKANPMKTGINASRLAIAAFIVPYIFVLSPAMLFVDTTPVEVVGIVITSCIGMFAVAAGVEGYMLMVLPWFLRILSIAGGLCLIIPGFVTDMIGLGTIAVVVVIQILLKKAGKAKLQEIS
ncbi:MAG: TRAP transporter permease, partial [Oscillospiraceae bacterium]